MEPNQMINIAKPQIGEEEKKAVLEVLDSGITPRGRVKAFE
jgi:dTDP-4-amino-4,6-dideoxygalactose transaminase